MTRWRGRGKSRRSGERGNTLEYRRTVRYIRPKAGAPAAEARPHIKLKSKPLEEAKPKEPLIDIFDRGDHISIIASIPNVKEDLKFEVAGDALKISADVAGTKIEREVSIPEGSEVDRILGASFKNGILEVKLRKKPRTSKEKG